VGISIGQSETVTGDFVNF